MATSKPFEQQYPAIDRLIDGLGWIEVGENDMISAFVRAYSEGGTVYEGGFQGFRPRNSSFFR